MENKRMKKVVFVCAENAGRSQMAKAFFNHSVKQRGISWVADSAGTIPADKINPLVTQAMADKGFNLKKVEPKLFDHKKASEYALIISFGCLVKSVFPKEIQTKIEEWHIDDPKDQQLEKVKQIRDQTEREVSKLLDNL